MATLDDSVKVSASEAGGALAADEDHRLAASVADEAGRLLVSLRAEMGFADPDRLKREGDRRSHDLIVGLLADARPRDRILSEEESGTKGRAGSHDEASPRVWIVDPLDGTREFSEEGRSDWAVHVALCVDGQPIAGAVALPAQGVTHSTADPPSVTAAPSGPPRLLVSRTRRPPPLLELAERLGAELLEMGSAGAKAMAVVAADADVYAHVGGQYEWDSAAPVAVAQAAGLHTSRLDGSPLVYDRDDPWLPDLLICRPELADQVLETLRTIDR